MVKSETTGRNIDLVLCEHERFPLISVRVAVENKTIMTAHGKARLNRYGDIIAYSNHVHNHRPDCIANAVVVINVSPRYENPDEFAKGLERPEFDMARAVTDTKAIFAGIPLRVGPNDARDRPEALAVIVVDYDGVSQAKLVRDGRLTVQPSSQVHYERFIGRICDLYGKRFSGR